MKYAGSARRKVRGEKPSRGVMGQGRLPQRGFNLLDPAGFPSVGAVIAIGTA